MTMHPSPQVNDFSYSKKLFRRNSKGSASGTESPGSHSPGPGNLGPGLGLILKSGTGTGTWIQNLRDLGPGLIFEKSGTRDWDRAAAKNPGTEPGLFFHLGPRF